MGSRMRLGVTGTLVLALVAAAALSGLVLGIIAVVRATNNDTTTAAAAASTTGISSFSGSFSSSKSGNRAPTTYTRSSSSSSSSSSSTSTTTTIAAAAPVLISSADGCLVPGGYAPTVADIQCDVVIVGAGPAGLYTAYRLLNTTAGGPRTCIVDDRASFGGKVQPVEAPNSTPQRPLFSPSHAEQVLGHHTTLRCLAQQFGIETYIRGSWSRRFKNWEVLLPNGFNTSNICPECWSFSAEKLAAPNGIPNVARYASQLNGGSELQGLPDLCNGLDYTACSYSDNSVEAIIGSNKAGDHAVFADFTRNLFESSEATNSYFSWTTGYGYITHSRDTPVQSKAGQEYVDDDWNSPSGAFYWPRGGPHQIWKAMMAQLNARGVRFFQSETAQCLDKATDALASQYRYVVRTDKRNVRAKRVVFATTAPQYADLVKGTYGSQLAQRKEMRAVSTPFPQCSFEMFFPTKWWQAARARATDAFCVDPACNNYTIIDTPGVRNYTEWTYYDPTNGYWFRYQPTPDIQEMNLIRMLPDVCQEWQETYVQRGLAGVNARVLTYLRKTFEPTGLTVPAFTKTHFSYEPAGFAHFNARTDATTAQVQSFAQQPDGIEKICFSGESWQWPQYTGWQQGAIKGSHNCFRGPALSDLLTSNQRAQIEENWESCRNSRDELLTTKQDASTSDRCLRLDNEVALASLAGVEYCPQLINKRSSEERAQTVNHPRHDAPHAMDHGGNRA